jgi:nucleolar protein 14
MLKVSKRASKFALLEDNEQAPHGLTHRGQKINDLQEFNDVNFDSEVEDEEFQQMHDNLNFTGFDEEEKPKVSDRPKSKTEVYKEIIEKSRLHKHLKQEIYEENLNKATELDEQWPELASKLQFRTRDSNVKDRLKNQDHEFEKLMNELRDDERVVSNKVIEKSEKYTDKVRQKKTQQLNALLKDSDEEGDIRSWVKAVNRKDDEAEDEEDEE